MELSETEAVLLTDFSVLGPLCSAGLLSQEPFSSLLLSPFAQACRIRAFLQGAHRLLRRHRNDLLGGNQNKTTEQTRQHRGEIYFPWSCGPRGVVMEPVASAASAGNLSKIQILRPSPESCIRNSRGKAQQSVFQQALLTLRRSEV